MQPEPAGPCPYCDRTCDACRYPIDGGWEHETRHFAGGVLTCTARRYVAPLVDVLAAWLAHRQGHGVAA